MKKIIIYFFSILLLSCTQEKRSDLIDLTSFENNVIENLSEIANSVDYIPLQTNESSLLGPIKKLKVTDRTIFVSSNDQIYYFDKKNGRFINKLNKVGRGPEEYSNLYDFDISSDDNFILIISSHCIMVYKKSNTDYLFHKKLSYYPDKASFIPEGNNIFLTYGTSNDVLYRNIIVNINGDTLNKRKNSLRVSYQGKPYFIFYENINYVFGNKLYFKELLSDTIFEVNNDGNIKPSFLFDSHGMIPTPEIRSDGDSFRSHMPEYILTNNIIETSRFIFYSYYNKKENHFALHDKTNSKSFRIKDKGYFEDNISGGPSFKTTFSDNDKLFTLLDPSQVKKYVSSEEFENKNVLKNQEKQKLYELIQSLQDMDNPILEIVSVID